MLLLVCDSFGVGEAPDAEAYGDGGSNTIGHVAAAVGGLHAPNLGALGLGAVTEVAGVPAGLAAPGTAHGRLTERSAGKDTITGHWEIAGIVLDRPFPTYPEGFPPEERPPVRWLKGTNGAPNSCSDVGQVGKTGSPKGQRPQGDRAPVVVRGRESRPHGEGGQVDRSSKGGGRRDAEGRPLNPGPLESRMLGNLPVRFGERGVETEHGRAIEAPATERAGNG